jgi:stage III sporulation protein AG
MITWKDEEESDALFANESRTISRKVEGVIVASEGAGDVIVKNSIINAVATVFDIPASNVVVFEKVRNDAE